MLTQEIMKTILRSVSLPRNRLDKHNIILDQVGFSVAVLTRRNNFGMHVRVMSLKPGSCVPPPPPPKKKPDVSSTMERKPFVQFSGFFYSQ